MKMNVYEKGLLDVIDYLLEERDGCLEDDLVGLAVQNVLKQFIHEVGVNGSEASDHASRGSMCFFDVEFALTHMDIEFDDLMELWEEEKTRKEAAIRISSPKTFDQDCHVGPVPMMGTVMEKDDRHIPDYMPEFPCIHTYQQTWIYDELERDDEDVRHRLAENSLYIQKAMNNYLVNSRPTTSLFLTPQSTKQYDLVLVEPSDKQRPAFFNALLPPRDSCNLHSIVEDYDYDDEDESSSSDDDDDTDEDVAISPFVAVPQLESKCPRKPIPDEDFEYVMTEPIVETTWHYNYSPSPQASESDTTDNDYDEDDNVEVRSDVEYWSSSE